MSELKTVVIPSHGETYNKAEDDWCFQEYDTGAEIVADGEWVCHNYGTDYFNLKQEHLDALSEGKILQIDINGNEYSLLIKMDGK